MITSREVLCRDVLLERDATSLTIRNASLALRFDRWTGRWTSLGGPEDPLPCSSPGTLTFHVGGETRNPGWDSSGGSYSMGGRGSYVVGTTPIGLDTRLEDVTYEVKDGRVEVRLHLAEGDYSIEDAYTLWPDEPFFTREAALTSRRQDTERLRYLELCLPGVETEEGDTFEAPGFVGVKPRLPVGELPQGRWTEEVRNAADNHGLTVFLSDFCSICLGLGKAGGKRHLLAMGYSEEEMVMADTELNGGRLALIHQFQCAALMGRGRKVGAGRQFVCLVDGTLEEAAASLGRIYARLDIRLPADTPDWMKQLKVYEAHTGPKFMDPFLPQETNCYEPYPTLDSLGADLQRIRGLGFNVLQLMPRFPFPGYTVHDYYDVDTHYGGKEALVALIERAHRLGMRVILDVIVHGCVDGGLERYAKWAAPRSRYLDEHPEWFMRTETGEVATSFTYSFDIANRDWQDYFIGVLRFYVEELGADGFRIDAPMWNHFPNWDPDIAYKAGTSTVGALGLFKRARESLGELGKDVVFFTEPGGPMVHTVFDITYSYDEMWMLGALVEPVADPFSAWYTPFEHRVSAREMRDWLRYKRLVYPGDSFRRVVRQIDSHDSFEWVGLGQFRREAFGTEAARAMFAANALLPGGVMNFAGGEKGSEDFYEWVLALRDRPEYEHGDTDFDASSCDNDMVYHLAYRHGDRSMLVVVNFAVSRTTCRLDLDGLGDPCVPEALLGDPKSFAYRFEKDGTGIVGCRLAPFEVLVLSF